MQLHIAKRHVEIIFITFPQNLLNNNVSNIEISKEPNTIRESSVTCSYIGHVNISKFVY